MSASTESSRPANGQWRAVNFFKLRRTLDAVGVFHRVGTLRDESVLIEVRLPTSFWEIEFHSDGAVEYESFRSTGAILDGRRRHESAQRLDW